jgi:hypothetical protein
MLLYTFPHFPARVGLAKDFSLATAHKHIELPINLNTAIQLMFSKGSKNAAKRHPVHKESSLQDS